MSTADKPGKAEQIENLAILLMSLDAFKAKALDYYKRGKTPSEKIVRAKAIQEALKEFNQPFKIAAKEVPTSIPGKEEYICPGGMRCVGGVCVPDLGPLGD